MKGVGITAVILATLMGATSYSVTATVAEVWPSLNAITTGMKMMYLVWLVMSIAFIALAAWWIYGLAGHMVVRRRLSFVALGIGIPVFGILDSTFTVVPFTLSVRIAFSGAIIGANFVPIMLLALIVSFRSEG